MTKHFPPNRPSDWSEKDDRLLEHVLYAVEYSKWHMRQREKANWIKRAAKFFESGVVVALVSVLIGGVFSQWVSNSYIAYKDFLDRRREVVKNLVTLVTTSMTAADGMVEQTHSSLNNDPAGEKLVGLYNEMTDKWTSGQEEMNFWLEYYYPGEAEVQNAWSKVRGGVTDYAAYAGKIDKCHAAGCAEETDMKAEYDKKKDKLKTSMTELFKQFLKAESHKQSSRWIGRD
jgi:hypothetical protein